MDFNFFQKIMRQKGKLFTEIQNLLSLKVENIDPKAGYCPSDKTITCSTKLLKEPTEVQEAVIMHELCHHAVFCQYGLALLSMLDEIAAVKLHFEKDPRSFRVFRRSGDFLSFEEHLLHWLTGHDRKKVKLNILRIIGIPIRGKRPQNLKYGIALRAAFFNRIHAEDFAKEFVDKSLALARDAEGQIWWDVMLTIPYPTFVKGWISLGKREYKLALSYNSFVEFDIGILSAIGYAIDKEEKICPYSPFFR